MAPDPGRVPYHRLNRAEYTNAIRDLLGARDRRPLASAADDSGHGFDNIAGALSLSPGLLERYLSAARQHLPASRSAIRPSARHRETYRVPINLTRTIG